jgi:hypothetical protein
MKLKRHCNAPAATGDAKSIDSSGAKKKMNVAVMAIAK